MAVTAEKSTQITNGEAKPPVMLEPRDSHGRLRVAKFDFTQGAAAGDATSTADLVKLPPGKIRVLGSLSKICFSAFGAARTLDVGYTAHTDSNGTTVVAAAAAFCSAVDVSAAGSAVLDEAIAAGADTTATFDSRSGVTLQAKVAGGTIPAAATLKGYIVYIQD